MTSKRFFGSYLHALVVHAPIQFELISLRSINTENQERFFGQARKSATAASNRQPQNVISTTVLRLQAKIDLHCISTSTLQAESKVAKASKCVPLYEGTHITEVFLAPRVKSWQQHLKRISSYLCTGEGIWWKKTCGYQFFDGDSDDTSHIEGPKLLHFRSTKISDVVQKQNEAWKVILDQKISLPTSRVQLYNGEGNATDELSYNTEQTGEIPSNEGDLEANNEHRKGADVGNDEKDKQDSGEQSERNESNSREQRERNESNSGEQRERNESNSGEQRERNESNSGEQSERNKSNSGEQREKRK